AATGMAAPARTAPDRPAMPVRGHVQMTAPETRDIALTGEAGAASTDGDATAATGRARSEAASRQAVPPMRDPASTMASETRAGRASIADEGSATPGM